MLLAHLVPGRYSKTGGDEPYTSHAQPKGWRARLLALLGVRPA